MITDTLATAALSTTLRAFTQGGHCTLLAYGSAGALKTDVIEESVAAAATNLTRLQVLHRAPDAGAVDLYPTGNTDAVDSATAMASNLGVGSNLSYIPVTSGIYRLRVTGAGDKTDLRLDVAGLVQRGCAAGHAGGRRQPLPDSDRWRQDPAGQRNRRHGHGTDDESRLQRRGRYGRAGPGLGLCQRDGEQCDAH